MFQGATESGCIDEFGLYTGNRTMESCENWSTLDEELTTGGDSTVLTDLLNPSNFPDASLILAGNKCR